MRLRVFGTRASQQVSLLLLACSLASAAAEPVPTHRLTGHVPALVSGLAPTGRLPGERRLNLALGLPLRNRAALTNLLAELYDPASTNYHRYLTSEQFAERFGPSEQDYESVVAFAQTNGFVVTGRHPDRALLDVNAAVADLERAFQLTLRTYKHPVEAREFHAPDAEPAVDAALPILDISGLDNYARPHPKNLKPRPLGQKGSPRAKDGSSPEGMFMGQDYRAAYLPGVALTGAGQIVGLLEFDGYYPSDITDYATQAGLTSVPLTNVLLDGFDGSAGVNDGEVALDIEMVMSVAPG